MKYSLRRVTEAVVIGLLSVSAVSAKMVQLTGTGYNKDVIDEIGGDGSARFFCEDEALYEVNYLDHAAGGLPSNGRIISDYDNTVFQLAPFTGNNAVIVDEDGGSAAGKFETFTLDADCKQVYERISIIGLGAGGQCNYSVVFFFTDGTSTGWNYEYDGLWNIRGEFDGNILPDWFNEDNRAVGGEGSTSGQARAGVGRVNGGGDFSGDNAGGGVRLQQYNYNLSLKFPGKTLDHITFEATGGDGKNRTFLAFTGFVADPLPTMIIVK